MNTNTHIEEEVQKIVEDVYFRKLDELPFAVNKEHAKEIVEAMVEIMKEDLRQALHITAEKVRAEGLSKISDDKLIQEIVDRGYTKIELQTKLK